MRIILIEKDQNYRDILKAFLEMRGHDVVPELDLTACPTYGSVDVLCPHDYPCGDVLLIDNEMPEMTGLEFIQSKFEHTCKESVHNKALMVADMTQDEKELAAQLGCTIFPKPFHLHSLQEWLESVEKSLAPERILASFN